MYTVSVYGISKTGSNLVKKGGVGKTTNAAHIAVAAHNIGHEVLLIDLAAPFCRVIKHSAIVGRFIGTRIHK
ncbi:hypothetical protein GCM10027355_32420 [Haloplanus salinarum]|uniref:ParA family protein n=1 Tax=Haloplanus salinarum TaxID=1912324 RepID=UPI003B437E05